MTLPHIFLLGALASVSVIIPVIRFANKTVKIRQLWDTALDANRFGRTS